MTIQFFSLKGVAPAISSDALTRLCINGSQLTYPVSCAGIPISVGLAGVRVKGLS